MSLNDLYYIFGIGNILFNIIISIITYLNKKTVENDKKEIEEIKKEVKESVESNKNERKSIEDITNLLSNLREIEKSLTLLRKSDNELIRLGTSLNEELNKIYENFLEVQNNNHLFLDNDYNPRTEDFITISESFEEDSAGNRKYSLSKLTEINTANTSFLRKLKSSLQ